MAVVGTDAVLLVDLSPMNTFLLYLFVTGIRLPTILSWYSLSTSGVMGVCLCIVGLRTYLLLPYSLYGFAGTFVPTRSYRILGNTANVHLQDDTMSNGDWWRFGKCSIERYHLFSPLCLCSFCGALQCC